MTNTAPHRIDPFIKTRSFGHLADVAVVRVEDGWMASGLFTAVGEILDGALDDVTLDRKGEARQIIEAVRAACDSAESRIPHD